MSVNETSPPKLTREVVDPDKKFKFGTDEMVDAAVETVEPNPVFLPREQDAEAIAMATNAVETHKKDTKKPGLIKRFGRGAVDLAYIISENWKHEVSGGQYNPRKANQMNNGPTLSGVEIDQKSAIH